MKLNGNGKAIENTNKLILLLVFLILCLLIMHFSHDHADGKALDWSLDTAKIVMGALLGAITADRVGRRSSDDGGSPKTPSHG